MEKRRHPVIRVDVGTLVNKFKDIQDVIKSLIVNDTFVVCLRESL